MKKKNTNEEERFYFGVYIPAEIWSNKEMSLVERCLLAEIHSLEKKKGCFASNEHFSNFLGVSIPTVKRTLKKLKDESYLRIENGSNGRRKLFVEKKLLDQFDLPPDQIDPPPDQIDPPILGIHNRNHNRDINKLISIGISNEIPVDSSLQVSSFQMNKWKHCLEILKKLKGFRLPDMDTLYKEGTVKWTKTGIEILSTLNELENGTFQRGTSNETNVILKPMVVADIEKLLDEQVDKFLLALDDKYWPKDKDALNSVRGNNFLKTYSKYSWLLWCMEREIQSVKVEDEEDDEVDAELIQDYQRTLYNGENPPSRMEVVRAIKSVYRRADVIFGNDDFSRMPNSEIFLSPESFAREYLRFLDGWESLSIGHVTSDKVWGQFENYIWKTYRLDFTMSREEALYDIRMDRENEERWRERTEREKNWKSGKLVVKKTIYDTWIRYEQFVQGTNFLKKLDAMTDVLKEAWIKEYGDVEWVEETIDGVVNSGGTIRDTKIMRALTQNKTKDAFSR